MRGGYVIFQIEAIGEVSKHSISEADKLQVCFDLYVDIDVITVYWWWQV